MKLIIEKIISLFKENILVSIVILALFTIPAVVYLIGLFKKDDLGGETTIESSEPKLIEEIFVEVAGAVKSPGLYKLNNDARVNDLIRNAGGFLETSSAEWVSKKLNLSRKLSDSEKVYIPFTWDTQFTSTDVLELDADEVTKYSSEPDIMAVGSSGSSSTSTPSDDAKEKPIISPSPTPLNSSANQNQTSSQNNSGSSSSPTGLINVNTASLDDLISLPGIGSVYADKIIKNRPYSKSEDITIKAGVPSSTVKKFSDKISY